MRDQLVVGVGAKVSAIMYVYTIMIRPTFYILVVPSYDYDRTESASENEYVLPQDLTLKLKLVRLT